MTKCDHAEDGAKVRDANGELHCYWCYLEAVRAAREPVVLIEHRWTDAEQEAAEAAIAQGYRLTEIARVLGFSSSWVGEKTRHIRRAG